MKNVFELRVPELRVGKGEFVAVVGTSGCGKSTLLDMLGLVLKPDSAIELDLVVGGETHDLRKPNQRLAAGLRRDCIGYVLQNGGLLDFLSLRSNIELPLSFSRRRPARDVDELARRLDIGELLSRRPGKLSGGQRQRAAIARALIHSPPLVLADEPTSALDPILSRRLIDLFRELTSESGVSVLMVTHDHALVRGVADRIFGFQIEERELEHGGKEVISTCLEAGDSGLYQDGGSIR